MSRPQPIHIYLCFNTILEIGCPSLYKNPLIVRFHLRVLLATGNHHRTPYTHNRTVGTHDRTVADRGKDIAKPVFVCETAPRLINQTVITGRAEVVHGL